MPAESPTSTRGSIDPDENQTNHIKLPADLEAAVIRILKTSDPLDNADFNPIKYINLLLPNEQSLSLIDVASQNLQQQMRLLENEIRELTRTQISVGEQGVEEVIQAKKAIEELFERIKQIKEKATQSEIMVQEITQDIKSLDYAKRHLTISITALKRLQMLVTAVGQLRIMAEMKQYRETAQLLQAVLQLITFFKSYKSIHQISDLINSVNAFQDGLKKQIFLDFESSFASDGSLTVQTAPLSDGCLVIDIMGANVRTQLINWYCEQQLREYKRLFRGNDEIASLENTPRRYAWLKRALKSYDEEHASIFPVRWHLSEELCSKFCEITREDFTKVLEKTVDLDVKTLLKNLQLTIEFEAQIEKRFSSMLEEKLIEKIYEGYKSKVSLEVERESFLTVISTALRILVRGVELSCEPALSSMSRIPWGTLDSVGDQSEYISQLQTILNQYMVLINENISSPRYFRSFCDKFVDSFFCQIINNLAKCKPISTYGAEQMLLDIHSLKTTLLTLPMMSSDNIAQQPTTFVKLVNKGIAKIESILKVVLSHDDPEAIVNNYILLIKDKNVNNFQKILELKGIKKTDQQAISDLFQKRVAQHNDLQNNSSVLSSMQLGSYITNSLANVTTLATGVTTDRRFITDRGGAAATKFKVLAGKVWGRKDGAGSAGVGESWKGGEGKTG
ncbi:2862_t:CDS:10 [Paraglomus occultum]|uniref:2862_t:CDS:1 n=1 Tax=Paraglomus occultum TaxID=144539 RepID=A0A9N9BFH3_9GLOM|nr:2862_t:CDS:10 [Paraglomus occultum]